jgi:hypothetical protein
LKEYSCLFTQTRKKGQKVLLLIEKLLDKGVDFSCQFKIDKNGTFQIVSFQIMLNKEFAFSGIKGAGPIFIDQFKKKEYYGSIEMMIYIEKAISVMYAWIQ